MKTVVDTNVVIFGTFFKGHPRKIDYTKEKKID